MLKYHLAGAMVLAVAPVQAADKPALAGRWINEDGRAVVEFAPCGGAMCGHIQRFLIAEPAGGARDAKNPDRSKRGQRLLGSRVFWGLTREGASWAGQGYMPEQGRNFRAQLTPDGSRLKMKGCVSVFCKTVTWTRTN